MMDIVKPPKTMIIAPPEVNFSYCPPFRVEREGEGEQARYDALERAYIKTLASLKRCNTQNEESLKYINEQKEIYKER